MRSVFLRFHRKLYDEIPDRFLTFIADTESSSNPASACHMPQHFQVKSPAVIHETFDDEVVIVNLDSGDYYSLSGAGVLCWECILRGSSLESMTTIVAAAYDASEDEISEAMKELTDSMLEKGLLTQYMNGQHTVEPADAHPGNEPKRPFVAPVLTQYSDMRDLLLIDPIHDVDETGWPEVKNESESQDQN